MNHDGLGILVIIAGGTLGVLIHIGGSLSNIRQCLQQLVDRREKKE